ncbi:hypothetical protein K438DRAFT_234197 [Mycena galopus ATCC 62051]|nr:hypothetical protein K438DRAFT_234197 [Mycena galopus ATCC 62051]
MMRRREISCTKSPMPSALRPPPCHRAPAASSERTQARSPAPLIALPSILDKITAPIITLKNTSMSAEATPVRREACKSGLAYGR